ncbi:MAG: hypothetical protein AB7O39_03205 [Flavobacteriaceae bacterium]
MGNLFGGPKPTLEKKTRMPDSEDPSILAERRKKVAEQRMRGGRDSTIMSDNLSGAQGKLGA